MLVLSPQITVYRLFDLADEVDLSQLDVERLRLIRGRGGAVKFERPPATLDLGEQAADGRRGFFRGFLGLGHSTLLRRLMERHAEITDVRSRVHGALTITEDLFYAKIHRRAMALYGATELAETMETRFRVLSDVYTMVSGESGARRAEILEAGILFLVLVEVVRAFF